MTPNCPAAETIQESLGMDDLEASFTEVMLFYQGFTGERMKLLPYEKDDLKIIIAKRNCARESKDFKTADHLREVLQSAGLRISDKTP